MPPAKSRLWARTGTWLFALGWVLILLYATSPLWQGRQHFKTSNPETAGALIADFPGGEAFALHQKSKSGAGDVPRVLALKDLPADGFLAVLSWGFDWRVDTRWSPCLLEHDGKQFLYAAGEQSPERTGKAGGKRVPSTHVMRLPWKGDLDERVYAINKNSRYFVLLPQSAALGSALYSVELRTRRTGAELLTHLLVLGLVALLSGVLILFKHQQSVKANLDVVETARAYARWRRFAQARQTLQDGLARQPSRQAELEAALREIEAMEKKAAKPR